jgi:hypothetical protein
MILPPYKPPYHQEILGAPDSSIEASFAGMTEEATTTFFAGMTEEATFTTVVAFEAG